MLIDADADADADANADADHDADHDADVYWCWLMVIHADWYWLMLINAQTRFNQVFFCQSIPPEFLW